MSVLVWSGGWWGGVRVDVFCFDVCFLSLDPHHPLSLPLSHLATNNENGSSASGSSSPRAAIFLSWRARFARWEER